MVVTMDFFNLLLTPANTTDYYIAGYGVFFIIMALYLASLIIRYKNLKKEYDLLLSLSTEMDSDE
jgi:hypothetical protein